MAAQQAKQHPPADIAEAGRKPRTNPERLKAFSERLNLMMAELGLPERGRAKLIKERVGVSGTTASNWLRGESYPSFEELGRIGQLGVDPYRLFPETSELARTADKATLAASTASKRLARLIESAELLPLTHLTAADAQRDATAFPNWIWQQLLGTGLNGFGLIFMKGDAMGERIKAGTPLLVDTHTTHVTDDNSIYALLVNEAVMVRRVQRRLQGGYTIVADNPAIAAETIDQLGSHLDDSAKPHDVLVLGRVALAMQKL
jgi:transcriptional regulator with XRE-family HTH domain